MVQIIEREVSRIREIIDLFREKQISFKSMRTPLVRGETSSAFSPTAGVFRNPVAEALERDLLTNFARHMPAYSSVDVNDTLNVLTLAQHHGVPTRLLDWSRSPLVGTFFACWGDSDRDCAVWFVWGLDKQGVPPDPLSVSTVHTVTPLVLSPRVQVQLSEFTIHPDGRPITQFMQEDDCVMKLTIPGDLRLRFLTRLDSTYGVNRMSLFPDLDGIGQHLRWRTDPALTAIGLHVP